MSSNDRGAELDLHGEQLLPFALIDDLDEHGVGERNTEQSFAECIQPIIETTIHVHGC